MSIQAFNQGREQLFASPFSERLVSARQVCHELTPVVVGVQLATITLARTAETDSVLFTTSDDKVLGVVTETDGFVAVDGKRTEQSHVVQIAFREDTSQPDSIVFIGKARRGAVAVRHELTDAKNEIEGRFSAEVIEGLGLIKRVDASFWTEDRLQFISETGGGVSVRTDPEKFLGIFATISSGTLLLEGQPEDEATFVPRINLGSAVTIPARLQELV